MNFISLPFTPRYILLTLALVLTGLLVADLVLTGRPSGWVIASLGAFGFLSVVGLHDVFQKRHSILRNYPIAAHLRFFFEEIRPELRQYLFESETDGAPFVEEKANQDCQHYAHHRDGFVLAEGAGILILE